MGIKKEIKDKVYGLPRVWAIYYYALSATSAGLFVVSLDLWKDAWLCGIFFAFAVLGFGLGNFFSHNPNS